MQNDIYTAELMEKNSIRKLIFRLGIPAMFGQFFNLLYSIVDRIFVGQIPGTGETALASIGICAPALTAVTAFAYMVGIGGASCMSISLGQKNQERAKQTLGSAVTLLLGISVLLTVILLLIRKPLLYTMGCSDVMYPYAETYFTIYILGTIASLLGVGLNQFLLAQGFSKQGMVSVMIGALVNVILDPILIFGCGMGIAGAAAATVFSQCCMAVYVIWQLCGDKIPVRLKFDNINLKLWRQIISIGSMSFLITILDNLIIILLNMALRRYGGPVRGDQLITCATRHYEKILHGLIGVFLLCGVYIGLLQIAVQAFPEVFVRMFLKDDSLCQLASSSIRMYTMALLGVAVQYALVDGLTAMGKIRFAFPMSVFRKIVYIICIFALPYIADIRFIFYAGTISDAIGALFSIVSFICIANPGLKKELKGSGWKKSREDEVLG